MKTIRTRFASTAKAFALVAMATIATTFTACQSADEGVAGAIPLVLGEVSVDAPHTTNDITRGGISATTRAAIAENPSGYTGIRKSRFVTGDAVTLTLDDSGTTKTVTATLGGDGAWSLGNTPVYIQPGKTVITAAYTATEQSVGIEKDNLVATTTDCTLAGSVLSLSMKHAAGMIDITPASGTPAITSITLNTAAIPTVKEDEEVSGVTTPHYRALATAASTITSLTAVIGGVTYEATLGTPIPVAANKRYPIALTFKNSTLTATVGAPEGWTDGGEISNTQIPAGYTRVIGTPEDLAQFAYDVNNDAAGTGASIAIVYQTTNIDISKLKAAGDAGINPLTGTAYTYTATADNWVPIGGSNAFTGGYNGNGHTISNVKFTTYPIDNMGLFGYTDGSSLTGIHLRNFQALDNAQSCNNAGALVGSLWGGIITLCSATGTIKGNIPNMGGLIGADEGGSITRCTARVDVESQSTDAYSQVGGLIGHNSIQTTVLACSAVSNIAGTANEVGGLLGGGMYSGPFGCYCGGTMEQTDKPIFNSGNSSAISCYSDMTAAAGFGASGQTYIDCAYTGSNTGTGIITGVTVDAQPANIYGYLTASNAITSGNMNTVKTLHWSLTDGYTLTVVDRRWKASKIWKDNPGAAPTIDLTYEGE